MSTTSPFNPGVELNAQFVRPVNTQSPSRSPFILGPAAYVSRYSKVEERAGSLLGQFSNAGSWQSGQFLLTYDWPTRPLGSTIDPGFTKLNIERGMLAYWSSPAAVFTVGGRDRLQHASLSFATNGAFAASSEFGTGVRVGDGVLVEGVVGGDAFKMYTQVRGFVGDLSTPAVSGAVAAPANRADVALAFYTVTSAPVSNIVLVESAGDYNGLPYDRLSDTYTITVTQSSTGGDWTTARLSIVSASGTDNHYNVVPAANDVALLVGDRSFPVRLMVDEEPLPAPLPDLVAGMTWVVSVGQEYEEPTTGTAGTYTATDSLDREYLVQVVQSGIIGDGAVVRISELRGRDAAVTLALTSADDILSDAFAVGSYGITMTLSSTTGLVRGDRWVVTATAAAPEEMRTLVLSHVLPAGVAEAPGDNQIKITLLAAYTGEIPRKSSVLGEFNYTADNTALTVNANAAIQLPDRQLPGNPWLPIMHDDVMGDGANVLYVSFRAWLSRSTGLLSIDDPAELGTLIPGPTDATNPVKYALSKALLASGGTPVFFCIVGDPNIVDSWGYVLELSASRRDIYGIVPLTTDSRVLDVVAGHVMSRSGSKYNVYRRGWYTNDISGILAVADQASSDDQTELLATILDDPDRTGDQYTLVTLTSDNYSFSTAGIRAGDSLRVNYSVDAWGDATYEEYTVAEVLGENTLRLVAGPSLAESLPTKIEVWRTLSAEDYVGIYSNQIANTFSPSDGSAQSADGRYPGFRFSYLPFGFMIDGTEVVPAYYAAAVVAAMRGSLAPHAPMTKMAIAGFDGVLNQDGLSDDQLNQIAAAGGFLFERNESGAGLRIRHAVTAGDFADINTREESIISNVDSINSTLVQIAKPYIGVTNISGQMLALMRADLSAVVAVLSSPVYGPLLGPQLLDFELTALRRSPAAKDAVVIDVNYEVPGPTNNIRFNVLIR